MEKIGLFTVGLLTSLGIYSTTSSASQSFEIKEDRVDSSTPLYLMHANNVHPDSLGIIQAEHQSHYSHSSHESHASHYSHYSSRW